MTAAVLELLPGLCMWMTAPEERGVPAGDPDLALVRRAGAGDRQAFDELYRRHVDAVFRRLTRLVGPVPEREDLVQQIFLDVFRALAGFRGDAAFSTWLHRVVVNVAYEHLRRRRTPAGVDVDSLDLAGPAEATPEAEARRREEVARALGMLAALKPKKRIAFVLRVVEGLPLEEIAVLVGAAAPAVGQRVKHAQRELEAMVERERRCVERREGTP